MADLASGPTDLADDVTDAELAPPDMVAAATEAPDVSASADTPANDDLLGELARAMHAAATSQYERTNAELERRRAEQVQAIAERSSAEAESIKAGLEADIAAVDAWAKAETEKTKQERLRRIDARRQHLAGQLERHETIRQREVTAIEAAIDTHRTEIDQFFGRMERETDPTAIAQVAAALPPFPSLAEIAETARRGAADESGPEDGIEAAEGAPASDELVSETRLMAVMDLDAAHGGNPDATRPWEAPHAVSVAAGSDRTGMATETASETDVEPQGHGRVGSTLLRTVRSIRPMAVSDKDDPDR
jgi:hypothetical protein